MNRITTILLLLIVLFSACTSKDMFKVEGEIANAEGKMLYFELFGIKDSEILDSVELKGNGKFSFKTDVPESPEFYRIRIDKRFIHLCADSARTVVIKAEGKQFGKEYNVEGSECCEQIRVLSVLQGKTILRTDSLKALYDSNTIDVQQYQNGLAGIFNEHRESAKTIIYKNPKSPAAYFALFQRFHDYLVFDPYNADDNKTYAAVATSWNTFYPNSLRTKHLVNLTLMGMKDIRRARDGKNIEIKEYDKLSYFEITLPNINGKSVSLSSIAGKVILLDFTAYQTDFSPSRNMFLREIHNEFSESGFEIFQVSLDPDENFWKNAAVNLPWICVRDKNSSNSNYLRTYNVMQIPTFFLINKNGEIVARDTQISDIQQEIRKLL